MSSPAAPSSPDAQHTSFVAVSTLPPSPILETAVHSAPIGEPITTAQNDPDFLSYAPPSPPGSASDRSLSVDARTPPLPLLQDTPEVGPIALSPPPRRGSRQLALPVVDSVPDGEASTESASNDTHVAKSRLEIDVDDVLQPPPEVDDFAPSSST